MVATLCFGEGAATEGRPYNQTKLHAWCNCRGTTMYDGHEGPPDNCIFDHKQTPRVVQL